MANILEENLRAFLLADTTVKGIVGDRIAYNHIPSIDKIPYIFFQQSGSTDDDGIGDAAGLPTRFQFAVECWESEPFRAKTLGRRVQQVLHKARGTFGDTTIQAAYAESQSDNYEPRGIIDESGFHGSFLNVEVVP